MQLYRLHKDTFKARILRSNVSRKRKNVWMLKISCCSFLHSRYHVNVLGLRKNAIDHFEVIHSLHIHSSPFSLLVSSMSSQLIDIPWPRRWWNAAICSRDCLIILCCYIFIVKQENFKSWLELVKRDKFELYFQRKSTSI